MGDDVLGRPTRSGRNTLAGHLLQISGFILARLATAVIVKSRQMASKLRMPSAHVIPNGVDLNLFRPMDQAQARRTAGPRPGKEICPLSLQPQRTPQAL